ncbi:MAG TPA: hypothetical protein VI387_10705 [Candidatus Brocadiales bacterium]|nr:hypothetical protein [Candidatus Brocadiales bacterium]
MLTVATLTFGRLNAGSKDDKSKPMADVVPKTTGVIVNGQVWNMGEKNLMSKPLTGCEITLFDGKYNFLNSTRTSLTGQFFLFLQPNTEYVVIIKKLGYLSKRVKIITPQDENPDPQILNLVLRASDTAF